MCNINPRLKWYIEPRMICYIKRGTIFRCLFPLWWFYSQKVLDEEVVTLMFAEGFTHCVACSWKENELEVLVRLLECIYYLIR